MIMKSCHLMFVAKSSPAVNGYGARQDARKRCMLDRMTLGKRTTGPGREGVTLPPGVRKEVLQSWRQSGKRMALHAVGISMCPMIRTGSRIEIEFSPIAEIAPGDLILFERNEKWVLHRVIYRRRHRDGIVFTEKGDHQPFAATVGEASVLGKVIQIQRGDRIFDPSARGGRMIGRLIALLSLIEFGLYRTQRGIMGNDGSRWGHAWVAAGSGIRRILIGCMRGREATNGERNLPNS